MATRETRADQGKRLARAASNAIGAELREARVAASLSQRAVARSAGLSASQVSRIERGRILRPTVDQLARIAVVLGLALSLRLYPAGAPVRDAGQLALIARFATRLTGRLRLRREVPLPIRDDLRAWDARIDGTGPSCAVEAEVRLRDTQELARRIALKLRDDPTVDRVILLVARSARNRAVLRLHARRFEPNCPSMAPSSSRTCAGARCRRRAAS